MASDLVELFVSIGLSEQKAKETLKNEQLSLNLKHVIDEVYEIFAADIILRFVWLFNFTCGLSQLVTFTSDFVYKL